MKNNIKKGRSQQEMHNPATLERLFGPTATARVLDFLIDHKAFDYSLSDIARGAGVAWSTINLIWPRLENNMIVIKTRNVGRATLYKLNTDDEFVIHLLKADWALTKREAKREAKKQIATKIKVKATVQH